MRTAYSQIIFIDPTVPERDLLIKDLQEGVKAVFLEPHQDAIHQMSSHLQQYRHLDAIHIVTHGAPGQLIFSNSVLNVQTLKQYQVQLANWSQFMSDKADILLYGCETGQGDLGREFVLLLAEMTNHPVQASSSLVGNHELGGTWELDFTSHSNTHQHALSKAIMSDYRGLLSTSNEVYFIDASVPDSDTLIAGLDDNAEIVFIESNEDGVLKMAEYLDGRTDIDGVHVISHGSNGAVYLGDSTLNNANLTQYQDALATIGSAMAEDGDILLYGCSIAEDENGLAFIQALADLTQADVAASDDLTGAHGDGELERQIGHIENFSQGLTKAFDSYQYDLATFTMDGSGSAPYTETVSGVTMTITAAGGVTTGNFGNQYGTIDNILGVSGSPTSLNISFNTAIDVTSMVLANDFNSPDITFKVTPNTGSAVNQTISLDSGQVVSLGFIGITSMTIAYDPSANYNGYIDTIVFTLPPSDPTITSSTYNASTGVLVVTGTNFTADAGADVIANKLTLTGEGGATYQLTDTADVEITSATQFMLTLSAIDQAAVNQMLNKNGSSSTGGTTFNLDAAAGFMPASAATSDATNAITVSNVAAPTVTSAAYDYSTGVLTVTGTGLLKASGATNDIDVTKLTIMGEGGDTRTLTSSDVEITDGTSFSVTLNTADRLAVNALLNKDGTASDGATNYNIAAVEDWNTGADAAVSIADTTSNAITVSNYAAPAITSATYDYNSNQLVLTGTNFVAKSGETNDVDVSLFTITGEGGAPYTLTSATDVDISSATSATITLSGADIQNIEALLNKDGTTSATAGTTFNLSAEDNWMAGGPASANISDATTGVTVSNYAVPAITSATFNYDTGVLTATGTNFVSTAGATNDIDVTKLTLTGEGPATYTLTGSNVEITSSTQFSVTLAGSDLINARTLLNKDGTASATSSTTFNLAAAEDWMVGAPAGNTVADATSGVTVSNYTAPVITSTTYDASTGVLVLTGTHFVGKSGGVNDIDASLFTFTGESAATYTLNDTTDVEITSGTTATITLSTTDKLNVNGLLNANGTASNTSNTTYNVAAADNWMAGAPAANNTVDATTDVTVSNVAAPTLSAVVYDFAAGTLTLTGTNFVAKTGVSNDVDVSLFTVTGEAGSTRVLTSNDVEVTSETSATITLNTADKAAVNALLNKDGTSSVDATTYNLAVADDWVAGALAGDTSNATTAITVSNYTGPTLTNAAFDFSAGTLVLTGTNFVAASGANNDVDASKLSITGSNGDTYTLTSNSVEITDGTTATVTLNASDLLSVRGLLDKNGTSADDATVYNVAATEDWMAGAPAANTIADLTGNGITVSNYTLPAVTSATYDSDSGQLVVTGTNFVSKAGATNDIDISTITLTGGTTNATYTITSTSDVEITNATSFTITLIGADKTGVDALLDKSGTSSAASSTYNIGVADNWMAAAQTSADIADTTGNSVTVSIAPKITSATYDASANSLVVTGSNILANAGGADIDASTLTVTGEGGNTYTLTDTADVERDSISQFTLTLSANDAAEVEQIINKNGTSSTGSTTYNIAAVDDWNTQVTSGDTADASNTLTVSNVAVPAITSTTYNATTGALVVTGTGFSKLNSGQDIDASLFTFTGESGETYTLVGSSDVEITSGTSFTITLDATDKAAVNLFMNKAGAASTGGTAYNLAAAEDWARGADSAVVIADTTGNGITVSNIPIPTITSATYHAPTNKLVVTGTNFTKADGSNNDIDASTLTFKGQGNATYTLTDSSDVDITSATQFTVTLSSTDKTSVANILNKAGTASNDSTTYNLAAAEDWEKGADPTVNIADLTGNGITATLNTAPTSADMTKALGFNSTYTFSAADFGFSDVDTGDTLDHITITTLPTKGTLELDGTEITATDTDIQASNIGNLTFTPDSGGTGADYASFKFTVSDGTNDSVTANTATLNVANPPAPSTPSTPTQSTEVDGATVTQSTQTNAQGQTIET
ncbi:DUF4347 domain-containing protein, partial [Marinomonas atlantica]|uniref:DUF4347 domain-containing protein n=1 Tax=Marinomonas atlantica TaxID=1806668 RepID=UPI0008358A15